MRARLVFGLMLAAAFSVMAAEIPYPVKPIRIIVGFPPAGSADIFARLAAQKMSEAWGHPVVVDNRPGAGSTLGSEIVAHSTPDGYTLMVVSASFATSAGLYEKLKYDPVKSFAPVGLIASAPNVFLANPSFSVKSARDVIALAKATPGKITVGSAGIGSITHLSGELFTSMAGLKVLHVPYKGGGPALNALVGGEIQLTFLSLSASLGQVQAGRARAIGVTSAKRSSLMPDVPAISESVPGYEATNWFAMLAPAGTPQAILEKLNAQINTIVGAPDMAEAIRKQGADPGGGSAEEFGRYVRSEIAKWTKIIKATGLKP
jgi:tripartite-type tricarboxylate transporter receptor subunit TctC